MLTFASNAAASPSSICDELVLAYRLEDRVQLGAVTASRQVERWAVSVGSGPFEIGHAQVLVINVDAGVDIADLVDPVSGTWVETGAAAPRLGTADSLDDGLHGHILLLDRVWLHPDHRGHGLGPVVAAAVIERLGRGCHLAVCYPAPFEETALQQPDERARAVEALSRVWAKVGFRHWRDGVWMLDLAADDIHSTLQHLVQVYGGEQRCSSPW